MVQIALGDPDPRTHVGRMGVCHLLGQLWLEGARRAASPFQRLQGTALSLNHGCVIAAAGALDIEYVKKSDFLSEVAALLEGIKVENKKIEDALTRGCVVFPTSLLIPCAIPLSSIDVFNMRALSQTPHTCRILHALTGLSGLHRCVQFAMLITSH